MGLDGSKYQMTPGARNEKKRNEICWYIDG